MLEKDFIGSLTKGLKITEIFVQRVSRGASLTFKFPNGGERQVYSPDGLAMWESTAGHDAAVEIQRFLEEKPNGSRAPIRERVPIVEKDWGLRAEVFWERTH